MADLRPVYVTGDGDVKGPASSSNNFLPLFAGTTGKLLKSSGTGVTTQGLAILDDNTPAEQRNTIGLDQVNNTSDVNKPVSTAQQTALNLKMNLTGDGAVPRLGAVSVNSNGLNANQQGAYLFWNELGNGATSLLNNPGDGAGGFIFRNINKDNTAETGRVTIDREGTLTSSGSILAAGSIYGANGAVTITTNGNVNGSAWGGWLNEYIANAIATTLGYNQTWQNVTSSRTPGVIYTNTSGRPICVKVTHGEAGSYNRLSVDGLVVDESYLNDGVAMYITVSAIVPSGSTYQLSNTGEPGAYVRWMELR